MKCTLPEISWHNRDPVLSVDIQPQRLGEKFFRLASGGTDSHVLIWYLRLDNSETTTLECAADLTRHQKPVNVVRFSPSGDFLASGDDDATIIIWKQKTLLDLPDFPRENAEDFKEQWIMFKVLRGHLQDVYDLSWSSDSKFLISGSVDNSAVLWDITLGKNLGVLTDHNGFVQGVSWDPCGQYVATMSSDRFLRIFCTRTKKIVSRVAKAKLPKSNPEAKPTHLFHDDTLKTFFRRLTFTPDGSFLIVPSGVLDRPGKNTFNSTLVFSRKCLNKPILYLPSMNQYSVVVRCCPVLFTLRPMLNGDHPLIDLPYRIVIAIATQSSLLLYDTQHASPIGLITNIHYTRITDLTWSNNGKVLVISSTDGYCSIVRFDDGELGVVFDYAKFIRQVEDNKKKLSDKNESVKHKVLKEVKIQPTSQKKISQLKIEPNKSSLEGKFPRLKQMKIDFSSHTLKKKKSTNESKMVTEEEIESKKKKNEEENIEIIDLVDDNDFHLVYEESMTQTKPLTYVDKIEADHKPILVLEEDDLDKKDIGDNKINLVSVKSDIGDNKLPVMVLEDFDKNKQVSLTPQKDNTKKEGSSFVTPTTSTTNAGNVTPGQAQKKTPRRVQLITLSSPKIKKKLL